MSSRAIGELVMQRLRNLDRVAYIRFASVYRDFRDIENFKEEVDALLQPKKKEASSQLSFLKDDELTPLGRRKRGRKPKKPTTRI